MKTPILGLRTVIYWVNDLQAARTWYAGAFGLEPYFEEPFYVGFSIGGYELGLQPDEQGPAEKAESTVAYWGVDDIESVFAHFVQAGAAGYEEPNEVGSGIWVATVKDPWGNPIGLIRNPHFTAGA